MQGSVSRCILGGRICPVEEQVLQMLRVAMLTGLSEEEQIVWEKNKIRCGKCRDDMQKSTTKGFTVGYREPPKQTRTVLQSHSTREERDPINTNTWLNTRTKSPRNLIKLKLFIRYLLSVNSVNLSVSNEHDLHTFHYRLRRRNLYVHPHVPG